MKDIAQFREAHKFHGKDFNACKREVEKQAKKVHDEGHMHDNKSKGSNLMNYESSRNKYGPAYLYGGNNKNRNRKSKNKKNWKNTEESQNSSGKLNSDGNKHNNSSPPPCLNANSKTIT